MAATLNTNASATLSPRPGTGRAGSSPWTQIVARGPESEGSVVSASVTTSSLPSDTAVAAAAVVGQTKVPSKGESSAENQEVESMLDSADNVVGGNGSKKPAWNKPSATHPETGTVMGGASWPSLSESTKASPKPPSSDPSLKGSSDASASPPRPQVAGTTPPRSSSTTTAPLFTQRQMNSNPNPNPPNALSNHGRPARQRSMKREGGGNASLNGGASNQPVHSTAGSLGDVLRDNDNSPKTGSSVSESSGKEHGHNNNNGNREGGQRSGGDYTHQRSSFRRGGGGSNPRGDSSSHQGYANRRGQDKGNHDWSHPRGFNGRDPVMPLQGAPSRGFMRPQPPAAPFVPPPPGIRPHYASPMGIPPELQQPLYYFGHAGGMPFVPQMPAAAYFFPPYDPQLPAKILNQIDYYFSNENLIKDTYLRQNMDENGWVSVHLIAGFKKVKQLTADVQLILDAVRASIVVETLGDKIRRRDDWKKWVMPPSVLPGRDYPLAEQFQGIILDERSASPGIVDSRSGNLSRSSSGGPSGQQESSK